MERLRWLPRDLGSRYVLANQAAFEVYVMEGGREVWQSKVIVGKRQNQTSEFNDEMETVVFNPYWGVPQSIIVNEMLPYLRQDPSYLDRNGYEVSNDSGRRISSSSVDWWQFGNSVPLNVRQPPGSDHA
jgi:murein L,D-transpeptidase YcbB/YkuD